MGAHTTSEDLRINISCIFSSITLRTDYGIGPAFELQSQSMEKSG